MSKGRSRKVGESESPKDSLKSEVESPKPVQKDSLGEEENNSAFDIPNSEINTKSEIEIPKRRSPLEHLKKINKSEKSEIKTMEVHHHPEVEKKGLKEYLLEGLMIFLAVMMGFFAESLREHISDDHKASDFAATLYSDLKSDTTELNAYLTYYRFATANTDTLMQLSSATDPKQIAAGKLYWFGLFGGAYQIFSPHNATMVEMKSSGSLRFFGDEVINRKLELYDQLCERMKLSEEKEAGIYVETRKARARIFEFKYNEAANDIYHGMKKAFTTENPDPYGIHIVSRQAMVDSFKETNPPLLSYDKTLFNEYVELVRSRYLGLKVAAADTLLHHATQLIALLNKKYDLQDE